MGSRVYARFYQNTGSAQIEETLQQIGLPADLQYPVSKAVLMDQNLSLNAKGLYAALCAFLNDGEEKSISQANLAHLLQISPATLLKYRNELDELQYIRLRAEPPFYNGPILYSMNKVPASIKNGIPSKDLLEYPETGLAGLEHGTVAARVMFDHALSLKDKGFYAYLQCLDAPPKKVAELAIELGCCTTYIYRTYHTLAGFTDKVPAKWVEKVKNQKDEGEEN